MKVTIANDRVVQVGDTVTLTGGRWFVEDYTFRVGDVLTVIEDSDATDMYMAVNDGDMTIEIAGIKNYPHNFK